MGAFFLPQINGDLKLNSDDPAIALQATFGSRRNG
jgi:hypothetical protein